MYHKTFVRMAMYCLAALMLVVNVTGVAASPVEQLKQTGNVFTVSPNGTDDTANIQKAFDLAKAAGPGSTVRLTAGNFRTRFIEVTDFDGTFKGAGQGVTVIDTFADQDCQSRVDRDQWPSLFQFTRGYPRISDLSFHITPAAPCLPYPIGAWGPDWRKSFINILSITTSPWNPQTDCPKIQKEKVSALVTNVTIQGEEGERLNGETDQFVSNVFIGLMVGGTSTIHAWDGVCVYQSKFGQGVFRLADNTFRKVMDGIGPYGVYNSSVFLSGNTFDTLQATAILTSDDSGSMLEMSHNRMENIGGDGILIWQGGAPIQPFIQTASVFNIHDNDISAFGEGNGVVAWDFDNLGTPNAGYPSTGKRAVLIVRDNRFTLNPPDVWGVWLEGVDDALILNNKFSGNSAAAFEAGNWGPTHRGIIAGNDLSKYTRFDGSPYKIVLEAGTDHYLVTGVPVEAVNDLGTNNLIGGKRSQIKDWLNQSLRDELGQKMDWVKRMFHGHHWPEH